MRLDERQRDVHSALSKGVRLLEHPVGLADPRREADVQLETAAPGALDQLEEVLGTRSRGHHGVILAGLKDDLLRCRALTSGPRAMGAGRTALPAITRCGHAGWRMDLESVILTGRPFDSPDRAPSSGGWLS